MKQGVLGFLLLAAALLATWTYREAQARHLRGEVAAICAQIPNLVAAIDHTLRTWPTETTPAVPEDTRVSLLYFSRMVRADGDWCGRTVPGDKPDLVQRTLSWHFGNASEELRRYQASAQAATPPAFQGTRGPVEKVVRPAPPVATYTDVRIGRHQGFDRIVFEFREQVPGYRIQYVAPPVTHDGSGEPVDLAGTAFLRIRLSPAAGYDSEAGRPTYTGPRELAAGLPALAEAEQTGDYEAIVSWALGLNAAVDFRVLELEEPPRLVIDVAHPPS